MADFNRFVAIFMNDEMSVVGLYHAIMTLVPNFV